MMTTFFDMVMAEKEQEDLQRAAQAHTGDELAMLRAATGAAFNFSPPNQRYFLRIVELLLKATTVRHRTDSGAKTDINEGVMAILTGIGSALGVNVRPPTDHVAQPPSAVIAP